MSSSQKTDQRHGRLYKETLFVVGWEQGGEANRMGRGLSLRTCPSPPTGPSRGTHWPWKSPNDSSCLSEISALPLLLLQLQLSLRSSSGQTLGSTGASPGVPSSSCKAPSGQGRSRICRTVGDLQPGDWEAAAFRPADPTHSHFPFPTRWKPWAFPSPQPPLSNAHSCLS